MAFDPRRLKLLFNALYRATEGERNAAASQWYNYLIDQRVHPDDIKLSVGDDLIARNQAVIEQLLADNHAVQNENLFLRRHVDARVLRDLTRARQITYRWFDLEDLARAKFSNAQGDLPRHWRGLVMKHTATNPYQMQRWERGVAPIPDEVFAAIANLPDPTVQAPPKARQARAKGGGGDAYQWPEDVLRTVVAMWLRGANKNALLTTAQAMPDGDGVTDGRLTHRIEHSPPPDFLNAAVRLAGQPIDWPELWLIGATIFRGTKGQKRQRGWRTLALRALGLTSGFWPPNDLNEATTQELIDALRERYIRHNLSQSKVAPLPELYQRVLDAFVKAGPDGATRNEIEQQIGGDEYRRFSELQKTLHIFDSGIKRQKQTVYVARQFADQHPQAWQTARERYKNVTEPLADAA